MLLNLKHNNIVEVYDGGEALYRNSKGFFDKYIV